MIIPTRLRDSAQLKGLDTDCCFYAGTCGFRPRASWVKAKEADPIAQSGRERARDG